MVRGKNGAVKLQNEADHKAKELGQRVSITSCCQSDRESAGDPSCGAPLRIVQRTRDYTVIPRGHCACANWRAWLERARSASAFAMDKKLRWLQISLEAIVKDEVDEVKIRFRTFLSQLESQQHALRVSPSFPVGLQRFIAPIADVFDKNTNETRPFIFSKCSF